MRPTHLGHASDPHHRVGGEVTLLRRDIAVAERFIVYDLALRPVSNRVVEYAVHTIPFDGLVQSACPWGRRVHVCVPVLSMAMAAAPAAVPSSTALLIASSNLAAIVLSLQTWWGRGFQAVNGQCSVIVFTARSRFPRSHNRALLALAATALRSADQTDENKKVVSLYTIALHFEGGSILLIFTFLGWDFPWSYHFACNP